LSLKESSEDLILHQLEESSFFNLSVVASVLEEPHSFKKKKKKKKNKTQITQNKKEKPKTLLIFGLI